MEDSKKEREKKKKYSLDDYERKMNKELFGQVIKKKVVEVPKKQEIQKKQVISSNPSPLDLYESRMLRKEHSTVVRPIQNNIPIGRRYYSNRNTLRNYEKKINKEEILKILNRDLSGNFLDDSSFDIKQAENQFHFLYFKCETETELKEIGDSFLNYYKNYIGDFSIKIRSGNLLDDFFDHFILIIEFPKNNEETFLSVFREFQYNSYFTKINDFSKISSYTERTEYILPQDYNTLLNMKKSLISNENYRSLNKKDLKKEYSGNKIFQTKSVNMNSPEIYSPSNNQIQDKIKKKRYDALDLLAELRIEIKKYSEILYNAFPDRIFDNRGNKFSHTMLSLIIGQNEGYIRTLVSRKSKIDPNYKLSKNIMLRLKENLHEKLGDKAIGCMKIIKFYEKNKFDFIQFIDLIEKELGRVSGEIEVTYEELSLILRGIESFVHDKIKDIKYRYSNYKFSLETLQEFKERLIDLLGEKAMNCLEYIEKYKRFNPNLPPYSNCRVTIENNNVFQDIAYNIESSYWYGFLCADGSLDSKVNRLTFKLATKDKKSIMKFAEFVGFDKKRIKDGLTFLFDKGKLRRFEYTQLRFKSKLMARDLTNLGFLKLKSYKEGLPSYVKSAIQKARLEDKDQWWLNDSSKIALAWLLGFYDGDGTLDDNRYSMIYSNNKKLLQEIKQFFRVKSNIKVMKEEGEIDNIFERDFLSKGSYKLYLGVDLTQKLMLIYEHSMYRKRYIDYRS